MKGILFSGREKKKGYGTVGERGGRWKIEREKEKERIIEILWFNQ